MGYHLGRVAPAALPQVHQILNLADGIAAARPGSGNDDRLLFHQQVMLQRHILVALDAEQDDLPELLDQAESQVKGVRIAGRLNDHIRALTPGHFHNRRPQILLIRIDGMGGAHRPGLVQAIVQQIGGDDIPRPHIGGQHGKAEADAALAQDQDILLQQGANLPAGV